jgi:hypothetical protein
VPCNLELLLLLHETGHVGASLPQADVIAGWKETFLAGWDRTIDGLAPNPDYRAERRAVPARTFDRLAEAAAESEAGE